ncbi:hypothetical protein G6O67_008221 [Ophiocordyceps sinensis]|uniref:Uncharacterized protein n=1 Tax=Ophiocordyceps sinensis TaxID=72228 RepID=A0A8H4LSI5_9HYPO|nr:hypothetical protein G6O67_008221 [Ophiocordyceps sinensis]
MLLMDALEVRAERARTGLLLTRIVAPSITTSSARDGASLGGAAPCSATPLAQSLSPNTSASAASLSSCPMAQPNPPTPPLLLTKRLNAFLHANRSPQLPTLLLITSHGKLLAHASPHAVTLLRTRATVAASLLAIHASSSVDVPSALPGACTPDPIASSPVAETDDDSEGSADDDEGRRRLGPGELGRVDVDGRAQARRRGAAKPVKPAAVTVQLSGGTVVIRRLKCGLLFVTIGPSAQDYQPEQHAHHHHHHYHHHENGDAGGSPSEVESLASAGGQTTSSLESAGAASVVAMRRHAGELARWLDDKLGTLRIPQDDGSMVAD